MVSASDGFPVARGMVAVVHRFGRPAACEMFALNVFRDSALCPEFRTRDRVVRRSSVAVIAYVHVSRCIVTL